MPLETSVRVCVCVCVCVCVGECMNGICMQCIYCGHILPSLIYIFCVSHCVCMFICKSRHNWQVACLININYIIMLLQINK